MTIKLNELWGHNVIDFNLIIEDSICSIHFDVDDFLFVLMCIGNVDIDWHDLEHQPIDGIFRGVLI